MLVVWRWFALRETPPWLLKFSQSWPAFMAVGSWVFCAAVLGRLLLLGSDAPDASVAACPLRAITGIPCPFCGCSHSLAAYARGDLLEGFWFHPLSPVLAALFTWSVAMVAVQSWRGRPLSLSSGLIRIWVVVSVFGWAAKLVFPQPN